MRQEGALLVLVVAAAITACAERAPDSGGAAVVCRPSENIASCYFRAATPQGDHSAEPVLSALRDALELPLEELRAKRYANYSLEPDQWTFEEVVGATFTSGSTMANGDVVDASTAGFIEAVKQPEARPALTKALHDLEEAVRTYE